MKIGFDAKRAFLNDTGLGNYSRNLINSLAKTAPSNTYLLYTPKTHPRFDINSLSGKFSIRSPEGVVGTVFPSFWRSFLLSNQIERDGLDIYHGLSHELPRGIERLSVKKVVTIHDLIFLRYPEQYTFFDRTTYQIKFKHACEVADLVIAVSEQTKSDIVEFFGINPKKIQVIYQSADARMSKPAYPEEKQAVRDKYNLPGNFILNVGAITGRKNLILLVKAVERLRDELDPRLVVVGKGGEYEQKVRSYIKRQGLEDRVIFLGHIPTEDLVVLHQMAQVFVYPSIFEGFGIPIIDSLWSGVPVITSKGSCFQESAGPNSIFVDPTNDEELAFQLKRVLTDEDLQKSMAEAGKSYVQRFSSHPLAKTLQTTYQQL